MNRFPLVRVILSIGATLLWALLASPQALATSVLDAEGGAGWVTYLNGGGSAKYASPLEACQAQYNSFVAPLGTFRGANPTSDWTVYNCDWINAQPYPTIVQFGCSSGYSSSPPGSCVQGLTHNRPCVCIGAHLADSVLGINNNDGVEATSLIGRPNSSFGDPVDATNGRLTERSRDYQTGDGLFFVDRLYSSSWGVDSPPDGVARGAGIGWMFSFAPEMFLSGSFQYQPWVFFVMPDGTAVRYTLNGDSWELADQYYLTPNDISRWKIEIVGGLPSNHQDVVNSSHQFILTDRLTHQTYNFTTYSNGGAYLYGQLTSLVYPNGYTWSMTYGTDHEVTQVQDSFGRTLGITWSNATVNGTAVGKAYVDHIILPDGTALKYLYDHSLPANSYNDTSRTDRLIEVDHLVSVSGSGTSNIITATTYQHEDARFPALLTGITDPRGTRYSTWTYDGQGRVATAANGLGADGYQFAYGVPGSGSTTTATRTVTNPFGKQYTLNYTVTPVYWTETSETSAATANTPASSKSWGWSGYPNQFVSSITDQEGNVDHISVNSAGFPSSITKAYGTASARTTNYTWDSATLNIAEIAAPGLTTDFSYDTSGRVSSVTQTDTTTFSTPYSTNGQTRTWAYTYTTGGLVASVDGPLTGTGDTVSYTYDANGYLHAVTDELGHTTTVTSVDSSGHPLSVQDPNGVVTAMTYTADGLLHTVTVDPTGADVVTTIGYDAAGDVTSVSKADGTNFTFGYDAARRLTSITGADGNVLTYTLDAMGNATETKVTNGGSTTYFDNTATFDELGRLLTQVGASAQTWQYGYDKTSNLLSIKDPRNNQTTQAFNGLRELIQTVDANSNATQTTRDGQGQVASVADPRSVTTSYVRNGWGEVIQESSPDIGTVVYERNKLGLITKKTDARSVEADYTYDNGGRLTAINYPAASAENVTFTYDSTTGGNLGIGHLTGYTDQAGATARTYNSVGLVATESVTLLGTTATTSYYYDNAANLQHIVYPSGRLVSYWRNAYGQISSVSTKETSTSTQVDVVNNVSYLPFSDQLISMDFGNGLNLWRTYDQGYRSNQLSVFDGSSALIQHYYGYQDNLNITDIWDNLNSANDEHYWYSATEELQNGNGPWGSDTFYEDGAHNLTWYINTVGSTTTTDQLTYPSTSNQIGGVTRNSSTLKTFTYDSAGNILTSVQGGTTTAYTYNNADRLASFTVGGTQLGAYTYNAMGQLVIRSVTNTTPSGTTVYFYDQQGHPIAEYDGISATLKREYIWLGGTPIAVIDKGTPSTTYYVHTDHLNRPIAMSDASKSIVARYVWQPFGGTYSYTGTRGLDLRFPGQMFQAESGLHYNWFRQYDPTIGRYTQPDPLGLEAGISRYAYVANDPIQHFDLKGLASSGKGRGGNATPNAAFDLICQQMGIIGKDRRRLHDEISGQDLTPDEIRDIAKDMFPKLAL